MDLRSTFPGLSYCPHFPTDRQAAFLLGSVSAGNKPEPIELLFGGAAGGGKSDAMLMAASMFVHVPGYSAIIFRKTFSDLALPGAIMDRSQEWWTRHDNVRWNEQRKVWTFPSGATIAFGYLDHPGDEYRYQGAEFQTVCFDELTQFEERPYTYLFSRLRRLEGSGLPVRMMTATNPGGVGHHWVSKRFIDHPGPTTFFIPSKLRDNPHLDAEQYEASLAHLPETTRKQLLDGDWGAFEGMAFDKFRRDIHVIDGFDIPRWWDRFESFDYGLNNPTAWYAWAADSDENLVIFDGHYQPGLPSETAPVILRKRAYWHSTIAYGDPASLATRTGTNRWEKFGEPATIQTEFEDAGLPVLKANNNPRSGYLRVRALLEPDPARRFPDWHPLRGQPGSPRLFLIGAAVPELVEQLETAPLQPLERRHGGEMVDPQWESRHGHAVAAIRYGAMSRPKPSNEPDPEEDIPPHLRSTLSEQELRAQMQRDALESHFARRPDRNLVIP